MDKSIKITANFHLPGLFEFYELYLIFLPIFFGHRDYFYDWVNIASIYGSPDDLLWNGGRFENSNTDVTLVMNLMRKYGISPRLTFSNSMLTPEHLSDKLCNKLCKLFSEQDDLNCGIIISSDILLDYLQATYPNLYFISSTTKVLTGFEQLIDELNRNEFKYVVPDFRLNKQFDKLNSLSDAQKDKIEFLCNECCPPECTHRKVCYDNVSLRILGRECIEHKCVANNSDKGYTFSGAMANPMFISNNDIKDIYMPMGFTNFKIEGRSLGSALVLEMLLYYLAKPEYHIHIRELLYLENTLDLF